MGRRSLIYIAIAALAATAACNTTGCLDNQSALPQAEFFSSATGKAISVRNLEISGVDAPDGAVLSPATEPKSKVYLPMRATKTQTEWVFAVDSIDDILTLDYEAYPAFAGAECGATYFYRIHRLTYTTNLIDSITLTDSLITNADRATIQIFFRTAGEGERE